jgi:hypothetical protein
LKATALIKVCTAASNGLAIGFDRFCFPGIGIVGIIGNSGSAFSRFGDEWSEVAFLIAAILTLSQMPLLFSLSSGLL